MPYLWVPPKNYSECSLEGIMFTFILGMIAGGILVAAYLYDREQDESAPRSEYDDSPDDIPQDKDSKK